MRVIVADDSALFRNGLALLLTEIGIDVVAQADTAERLLTDVASTHPDAVIVDIRMPPTFSDEGIVAATQIHATNPRVAVLVLSTYVETEYAVQLLEHGASGLGYLLKDRVDDAAGLYGALQRLVHGETVVDPDIVSKLLIRRRDSSPLDRLTGREHQILDLMAQGRTNAGISAVLFISPKTVEAGVASIFDKLQLRTAPDTNRRVLAVLTRLRADRGFG